MMYNSIKQKLNSLFNKDNLFVLYLFLVIFAPPLVPKINSMIVVAFLSFLYMIIYLKHDFLEILKLKFIKTFILLYGLFVFYLLFIIIINFYSLEEVILVSYRFLLICPIFLTCIIFIILYIKKNDYSLEFVISAICKAGLIQLIITLLCLFFPSFKTLLIEFQYFITGNELLIREGVVQNRFNGFSESLLDSFGFGTGIIAILPIYLSYKLKNPKYYIVSFILVLVPFFNARSGLVIYFILFLFSILTLLNTRDLELKKKFLKVYIIISIFFVISLILLYFLFPNYVNSMTKDFASIINFFIDGTLNAPGLDTASNLFSNRFWTFSNSLVEIIFGTGHTVFGNGFVIQSDVGYVNDVWLFGIVGSILLYISFIYLGSYVLKNSQESLYKILTIGLIVSLFVFQIKGRAFMYSVGTSTILIILFCISYIEKRNTDKF